MIFSSSKRSYALVLGGGGAKGAYEIGAWRAFREEGLRWSAVIGTSVGTINAALVIQDNFELGEEIWRSMGPRGIIELPPGMVQDGRIRWTPHSFRDFFEFQRSLLEHGGLDTKPLRDLVDRHLNEEKIRASGIDLGIVTYDLTAMKPRRVFLETIPPGKLKDYILASAALPFFEATKIGGVHFADGGLYENVPAATARARGYRRLAVVDLLGPGNNRPYDGANAETLWVRVSKPLGGILDFNPRVIADLIDLGYLDGLRALGKRKGQWYFLRGGERWLQRWVDELRSRSDLAKEAATALDITTAEPLMDAVVRAALPDSVRLHRDPLPVLLEVAALSLQVPQLKSYRYDELHAELFAAYDRLADAKPGSPRHHQWKTLKRDLLGDDQTTLDPRRFFSRLAEELTPNALGRWASRSRDPWLLPAKLFFFLERGRKTTEHP